MSYLLPAFKAISLIFSVAAIYTGLQALLNPVGFSKSFGIPLNPSISQNNAIKSTTAQNGPAQSYVSLMGVRQLSTGLILLVFAYQDKWTEMATILFISGIVVAGTDGMYLWRAGRGDLGGWHAGPRGVIAGVAAAAIYSTS